jgi:tRNA A37 N6-isopentenylltransferase MiaA
MLHLDIETLKKIWDNPKATVLEKTIAQALRKSMEKGKLDSVETLLTRVYGKPKEKLEQELNITNKVIKLKFGNEEGDN